MKWENLSNDKCPCCSAPLLDDKTDVIRCTMCKFKIERWRMEGIKKHRSSDRKDIKPHFWQNLHKGNCVLCNHPLKPKNPNSHLLLCTNTEQCDFKIGAKRMAEILGDPSHSANKFNA